MFKFVCKTGPGLVYVAAVLIVGCRSWREPGVTTVYRERTFGRTQIMSRGIADVRTMGAFLRQRNPSLSDQAAYTFARIYREEALAEGVNADVAFVQMCLETDFLRYGNQVAARQNNFCGLGATDDGARGAAFPDVRTGVRAHIQHLKAYASRAPLRNPVVDPRFALVQRGSSPYVDQLAGRWATDPQYAAKLQRLLQRLHNLRR